MDKDKYISNSVDLGILPARPFPMIIALTRKMFWFILVISFVMLPMKPQDSVESFKVVRQISDAQKSLGPLPKVSAGRRWREAVREMGSFIPSINPGGQIESTACLGRN